MPAWRLRGDGLAVDVRVTPNAGADRIDGAETRDDGAEVLRIRVRAVPDKGKANAVVAAVLARALGVPKSAVAIVSGETGRQKTVLVRGDGALLQDRIKSLLQPAGQSGD